MKQRALLGNRDGEARAFLKPSDTVGAVYESVLGYPEAKEGTPVQWWIDFIHPNDRGPLRMGLKAL